MERGFTLLELLVVILLIPLLGLTVVQLDMLTENYFNRASRSMITEDEAEIALNFMERDVGVALNITVYSDAACTVAVPPGTTGLCMQLVTDDSHDVPPDPTNDDNIRYSFSGGAILRDYQVVDPPARPWEAPQTIARNISGFELVQTLDGGFIPQNVIRATVIASLQGTTATRQRYMTSRLMHAALFLSRWFL